MLAGIFPYAADKNLGRAYNEQISRYHDDDWLMITDYDVLILLHDTIVHIGEYTLRFPETGVFTCFTNRLANKTQLLNARVNEDDRIKNHIQLAALQKKHLYQVTELTGAISGMLMVIKKSTWNEIKFPDNGLCLGVDNIYCNSIMESGRKVLRMDGVYVWHTYRLIDGIKSRKHLLQ